MTPDIPFDRTISVFNDPFSKSCITNIYIRYTRAIFSQKYYWKGTVEFENGLTSGKQTTPECDSYEELMIKMKQIYDSLNVKTT